MSKTIWGICALGHDGSLSVVKDGEIVFAGHTERYTRIKNDPDLCPEIINQIKLFGMKGHGKRKEGNCLLDNLVKYFKLVTCQKCI